MVHDLGGHGLAAPISRSTDELHFPHSLGLLYSAFTYYTGFKVNSGEYKVMGLAPYGEPKYARLILDKLIDLKADGSFRLDLGYFDYCTGLTMTNDKFAALFGEPARTPEKLLTPVPHGHRRLRPGGDRGGDAAADALARCARPAPRTSASPAAWRSTASPTARCCATAASRRSGSSRRRAMPAGRWARRSAAYYLHGGRPRVRPASGDGMRGAYLGPSFTQEEIERRLEAAGARFETVPEADMIARTAADLAAGKAVGWFQGRMEFGPRALGARSILGDPRSPSMQKTLNLRVKYRESFRPFAPSVLREEVGRWFELEDGLALHAAGGRRRARAPPRHDGAGAGAVRHRQAQRRALRHPGRDARRLLRAHPDRAPRHQPRYHALLGAFQGLTGCPVLVNTSFNVRGEPIVCTPEDAFRCFMGTDIERLVVGNCLLAKEAQDPSLKQDYKEAFELD